MGFWVCRRVDREHERVRREVRDLPILGAETRLIMERRRMDCLRCGPKLERLSWLESWARVTKRLADAVASRFVPATLLK